MIVRLLLFGLLVWLAFRIMRILRSRNPDRAVEKTPMIENDTVRCDYCGAFCVQDEAILRNGRHYCSETHAESAAT